jgi:hypothetical protein
MATAVKNNRQSKSHALVAAAKGMADANPPLAKARLAPARD